MASYTDLLIDSFYAWEHRGRGWLSAPYTVDLEPPHRPFFILPSLLPPEVIDDGKRHTFVSRLIERAAAVFRGRQSPPSSAEAWAEDPPFAQEVPPEYVTLTFALPPDFESTPVIAIAILRGLLASPTPIAFEVISHAGAVQLQLAVDRSDAERVSQLISGFAPDVSVREEDDLLRTAWRDATHSVVVDLGLANECFLPITTAPSFAVDSLASLIAALAMARKGEAVALQVLFQRTLNPWGRTIRDALVDDDGDAIFVDAPDFVALAKEKTAQPIAAAVLRVGACAASMERAKELVRSTFGYFQQFERGRGNAFTPLPPEIDDERHVASLLDRTSYRTGMLLSYAELAQLVHLPGQSVLHSALLRERWRAKEAPQITMGDGIVLGTNVHRGEVREVHLPEPLRLAHTHLVGASGTGKSTLLLSMLAQDMEHGHGLLLLEPHGDLADEALARVPPERRRDVCLINPADPEFAVTFNPLAAETEIGKQLLASDLVAIFSRYASAWGDTMSTVLGNAIALVVAHPNGGTLLDLRRLLLDEPFRRNWLNVVTDPELRFFWETQYPIIGTRSIGPLLTRLDQFLRQRLIRDIVAGGGRPLAIARMIAERRIVIARLSQGLIGKENAYLLGSLLLSALHHAALARQALPPAERHPFFCYADEGQHFVTDTTAALLSESRKYGVGFAFAHQALAQLDAAPEVKAALLANAHTRIVFRVGDDDARELARGFSAFEAIDLQSLPTGHAVARIGGRTNDFNLSVHADDPLGADVRAERIALIRQSSNAIWASPRSAAPARSTPVPAQGGPPLEEPMLVAPLVGEEAAPIPTPPPKRVKRPVPEESATLGRGGKEHKYLQHLVKRLAEERGFRATVEGAAGEGRADLVLSRDELTIACEISVTTGIAHEEENLKKCIAAGFTRVLFIAPEAKQREKVAALLAGTLAHAPIEVIGPEDVAMTLDRLVQPLLPRESVVRGYKVKVKRQSLTAEEVAAKRAEVAKVIARGVSRS